MSNLYGFDIWRGTGVLDIEAVKKTKYKDFIMIKIGGADDDHYLDSRFKANFEWAKRTGIPVGGYFVCSQIGSSHQAIVDASYLISNIKNMQFEYPIALDFENRRDTKNNNTAYVNSFLGFLQGKGYYSMLYTNPDYIRNQLGSFEAYDLWIANYTTSTPSSKFGIWQQGIKNKGEIPGINTSIDVNLSKHDYTSLIKTMHLNNF